ncbi:MAG: helix-turn-helix transcriptional regulator [Candidatus Sumerlaeia bacterium]|nr:helix-turn-helix transcriptional regulator [Candidatus Sumerlaeia bacterium]
MIYEKRIALGLTQDQFGAKYDVSGPAIFKFEKGYVNPSLKLWMRMAADFDLSEGVAVLLWAKAKLPTEYQELIDLKGGVKVKESEAAYRTGGKKNDFSRIMNRDKLRAAILEDTSLPQGLRAFLKDEEVWTIYKPTGREVNMLRDFYGRFGDGTKGKYREALRALREFTGRES